MTDIWPKIVVEVGFQADPNQVPIWTDISGYALEVSIRRGRASELDRVEAGTLTLVLDNRDQRFDPLYAAGPYYGDLLPMRRIRVSARWKSGIYPLFTGFVEEWLQKDNGGLDLQCQVTASDGFKVLAIAEVEAILYQQMSGARIQQLLDDTGMSGTFVGEGYWVLGDKQQSVLGTTSKVASELEAFRLIDAGQSEVMYERVLEPTLTMMQRVEEAERGKLFMDAQGRLVFQDRHYPIKHMRDSSATVANRPEDGDILYGEADLGYDDEHIYNDIRASRRDGHEITLSDSTSQGHYLPRRLEKTDLVLVNDTEVTSLAHWLLTQYKDVQMRVKQVTLDLTGGGDADMFLFALQQDLSRRILFRRRGPMGELLERACNIEAVNWDIAPGSWRVTWQLSPALETPYFIVGDSEYAVLGTTTRLAS